ncbi:MAG TPA: KpsF/GutQ family sugar-phosphate isomerase, partial [Chitinophagaceae bacterium]|nr:KpsF/GutQ family sugar-phosphate isomerase [Chitinophagaceae bacterium]
MMNDSEILTVAADVIRIEHQSIGRLEEQLMPDLVAAIRAIMQSGGRVVVSGIGKSAIIAQKMVATFNSTGTPSVFLHAADAIHGDLGIIQQNDVAILLSKSGESPEIKVLVPLIRNFGNTIIAITGNSQSFLAKQADHVLNSFVETEACPNNLAPTSSTTAQMVVGDVLAVCLLKLRGFQASDFARFHPGGALGKQLYLKVCDLSQLHEKPAVKPDTVITEVIMEISGKRLGATAVLNEAREVLGIV